MICISSDQSAPYFIVYLKHQDDKSYDTDKDNKKTN
jgi:hypothetical protein